MTDGSVERLQIPVGRLVLTGDLVIPDHAQSLVIFSHGSGSGRFSPRNNFVAQQLHKKNIGTFLVDLLTPQEDTIYANRFNIAMLTERLVDITRWLASFNKTKKLAFGYFGASTGAASALNASVLLPQYIEAIVSRGGRPDLANSALSQVKAPTLLIVGGLDSDVLLLNEKAFDVLTCEKKLSVVAHATHLFEEQGALEEVSVLANEWFDRFLISGFKSKRS